MFKKINFIVQLLLVISLTFHLQVKSERFGDDFRPPSTPGSISIPSSSTNGTLSITWARVYGNVNGYILMESKNSGSWVTIKSGWSSSTSYTRSGLGNGSYKYKVRAFNDMGASSWRTSSSATVSLPPAAPSSITLPNYLINDGKIAINWAASSTATKYLLQESFNNASWVTIVSNTTARSYTRTGRGNGSYQYRVKAGNNLGWGAYRNSSVVNVLRLPGAPSSVTVPAATVINGNIQISWPAMSTATKYKLQESKNGGNWATLTHSTTTTSYTRTGRTNGSYKYRVGAYNASGWGAYRVSASITVLLPPPTPSSLIVPTSTVPNGTIAIGWPVTSTATKYQLRESKNGGSWVSLTSSTTGTSYTRTGRANGSYKYQVRAYNTSGWSGYRVSVSVTVLLPPPTPTSIIVPTTTVTNGTIAISWPATSTATKYQLQESKDNGSWVTLSSALTGLSYTPTGRATGSYKYQLRAYNTSGWSGYRVSGSVTVLLPPPTPTSIIVPTTTVINGTIAMSWPATSTATKYQLQESKDNGSWVTLSSALTGVSYNRTGRTTGSFLYRIRAYNASGWGGFRQSTAVTVLSPPDVPAVITVPTEQIVEGSIQITWSASPTASSYTVQERRGANAWQNVTTQSSRNLSRYRSDGEYTYRVKACNISGCSNWQTSISATVMLEKQIIFIHTDLLGSPVAESNINGDIE
jgi:predicted phage tail protein